MKEGVISDIQWDDRGELLRAYSLYFGYISVVRGSALSINLFFCCSNSCSEENENHRPYSVELEPAEQDDLTNGLHKDYDDLK